MKKINFILAFTAFALFSITTYAQREYDYIGTDNLIVEYRVLNSTGPSNQTLQGGVVSGFSSGEESVKYIRINTKTKSMHFNSVIVSYSEEDTRQVLLDDCVLYTGTGYLTKTGGEAPFQIKEFPDNTVRISITFPKSFSAMVYECQLDKCKEMKVNEKKKK